MKTILLLMVSVLTFSCVNAQNIKEKKIKEADVPENVKKSFNEHFRNAKVQDWEKDGMNYEADFVLDKIEMSAVYDSDGNFQESEQDIKVAELPESASDYSSKTYPGYKLSDADKIKDASGRIMFEVDISKGTDERELIFDDKGNFVKEAVPEKDDDKK